MQIKHLLHFATKELKDKNINSASLDAELLLCFVLDKPREFLYSHETTDCTDLEVKRFHRLVERRKNHEPIAYIIGKKEFYGLNFVINKNVLIPRPETELLVEETLKEITKSAVNGSHSARVIKQLSIVDLGTGSGNIIISLAKQQETLNMKHETHFYGIDYSKSALKIAKQNSKNHKLSKKIKFLEGNLLDPIVSSLRLPSGKAGFRVSSLIIVANLPYIKDSENLPEDVKNHEPHSALFAGADGLKFYKELFEQINNYKDVLRDDVVLFLEIDPSQKSSIKKLANNYFRNSKISFIKDLAGKTRVCKILL